MKILIYNWAPYAPEYNLGGGVSTVCRNLIDHLRSSHRVTFLYSGTDYSFKPGGPYWRRINNSVHPEVQVFSIVNSPTTAPAALASGTFEAELNDQRLSTVFQKFLETEGHFDVIHFHNLEGLTIDCLRVAKESGARTLFSLHNYWRLCPQVNLWRDGRERCDDYDDGRRCVTCLANRNLVRRGTNFAKRCNSLLANIGLSTSNSSAVVVWGSKVLRWLHNAAPIFTSLCATALLETRIAKKPTLKPASTIYGTRRKKMLEAIGRYVDVVHAASHRQAEIYSTLGLPRERLVTFYFSSKMENGPSPLESKQRDEVSRVVYLGRFEPEKGIDFLLNELEHVPDYVLSNIELFLFGRALLRFGWADQLERIRARVRRLEYIPHLEQGELFSVLRTMDLGLMPSMSEDVMPQAVLELVASGIPVLCSDRGGGKEIVKHPDFIFSPDEPGDFIKKFSRIISTPKLLEEFLSMPRPKPTWEGLLANLTAMYGETKA